MNNEEEVQDTADKIEKVCFSVKAMLKAKNERYGNSALDPLKIFSSLSKYFVSPKKEAYCFTEKTKLILTRIDDKLSRLNNSKGFLRKNDLADLIGYLILLSISLDWLDFDDLID